MENELIHIYRLISELYYMIEDINLKHLLVDGIYSHKKETERWTEVDIGDTLDDILLNIYYIIHDRKKKKRNKK
jgi:hypothetical protein